MLTQLSLTCYSTDIKLKDVASNPLQGFFIMGSSDFKQGFQDKDAIMAQLKSNLNMFLDFDLLLRDYEQIPEKINEILFETTSNI